MQLERISFERGSGIHAALLEPEFAEQQGFVVEHTIPLADVHLPAPHVPGHGQALVYGRLGELKICLQTGRLHPYEGHDVQLCVAAMQAVLARGVGQVMLTCAVGAPDKSLATGTLVSLRDQMALFAPTPLRGPHFIDASRLYRAELRALLAQAARSQGIDLKEAVYAHARGPQYETPAEVDALRKLGGDVVGMSTTYEAVLAAAYGAPCCGLGVVTNAAGDQGLSHADVQKVAKASRAKMAGIVYETLRRSTLASPTGEGAN